VVSNCKSYEEFSRDVFLEKEEALGMLCTVPVKTLAEDSGTEKGTGQIFTQSAFVKGRDSSVGVATGYGLDGPAIESRWGRDFSHTSRQALGPTHPPVQWVPSLSRG
jgi:hypothetical protein